MGDEQPRAATDPDDSIEDALDSVTYGALVAVFGLIIHRILSTATAGLLTRGLGPAGYGLYSLAIQIQTLLKSFTDGANSCLDRYLSPADTHAEEEHTLTFTAITALLLSATLAALLYMLAPSITAFTGQPTGFTPLLRIMAVGLPFSTALLVITATFRARGEVRPQNALLHLAIPAIGLITGIAAYLLGLDPVPTAIAGTALTAFLTAAAAIALHNHTGYTPRNPLNNLEPVKTLARYTGPMIGTTILISIQYTGYYAFIAYFATPTAAGAFTIAALIGNIVRLPLDAINHIIAPAASTLHDADATDKIAKLHQSTSRLILLGGLPLYTYAVTYHETILHLFSPAYEQYSLLIPILATTHALAITAGSVGILLTMTDHQDAHLAYNAFITLFAALSSIALGHLHGIHGIALAMALTITINNIGELALLKHFEGFHPFTRHHIIPLAAAAITAILLHLTTYLLGGIPLLAVGALTTLTIYPLTTAAIGLPETDTTILTRLRP